MPVAILDLGAVFALVPLGTLANKVIPGDHTLPVVVARVDTTRVVRHLSLQDFFKLHLTDRLQGLGHGIVGEKHDNLF